MANPTTELRLERQAAGTNANTWGDICNVNFSLIEDAISGVKEIATTGGTTTLTTANAGASYAASEDEARYAALKITGALVSSAIIVIPAVSKIYHIWNATSGAFSVTIKVAGIGVTVAQGKHTVVICDGADVYTAYTDTDAESVKNFGAVGDGVVDDTAALQAAINSAAPIVRCIPGAIYLLSTPLNCSVAGQTFDGNGAKILKDAGFVGTQLIGISAANVTVENFEVDGGDSAARGIGATNATADGLTIRGNHIYNCVRGINATNVENVVIERNYVHDVTTYGIFIQNNAYTRALDGVVIRNNTIDLSSHAPAAATGYPAILAQGGLNGATYYETRNFSITGNKITHCIDPVAGAAECCEMRYINGGVFSGNTCTNASMAISVVDSNDVSVSGNTAFNPSFFGIEVAGPINTGSTNISITGNSVDGNSLCRYAIALQGDLSATPSNSGISVAGNTVRGCANYGILVTANCIDVTITGNTVDLSEAGSLYGIYIIGNNTYTVSNIVINGNIVQGNGVALKAIFLRNCYGVSVVGNLLHDWLENTVYLYGATMTLDSVAIVGNDFGGQVVNTIGKAGTIGDRVTAFGNPDYKVSGTTAMNMLNLNSDLKMCWGSASPEGAVTAGVGSTYTRTGGGAGTSMYVKESGTGNTGWVGK